METNEIINNEVMTEVTEEIANVKTSKGLIIGAAIGVGLVVVGAITKFVAIPLIKKIKAKKEHVITINSDDVSTDDEDLSDD